MKIIITVIVLLSSCSLTQAEKWEKGDKMLMGSYLTLSAMDVYQTSQNEQEYNPLMRRSDGSPNMPVVVGIKLLSAVVLYVIADKWPKYRSSTLWVANTMQGSVVLHQW